MWGNIVFDVYARTALENIKQGKSLDGTGLKEFQKRLNDFLINERLLTELLQAVLTAKYITGEVLSKSEDRLLVLKDDVKTLEAKIEKTKPCIEMMRKIVQGLKKETEQRKSSYIDKIDGEYYKFFSELVRKFEREFEMPSVSGLRDNQRENYRKKLEEKLADYQHKKLETWYKISQGILSVARDALSSSFNQEIEQYNQKRDEIREILSSKGFNVQNKAGLSTYQVDSSGNASISSAKAGAIGKMVWGATGGTVGTVAAGVGGATLANLAGAHIVLGTIGAGLSLTPVGWGLLGIAAATGGITAWWQRRGEIQRFQKEMLGRVKQEFEKLLDPEQVSSFKKQIGHWFSSFEEIAKQLDEDITSLEKSLNNLLESKKTTEVNCEAEQERLQTLQEEITNQLQIIEAKYQEIEKLVNTQAS